MPGWTPGQALQMRQVTRIVLTILYLIVLVTCMSVSVKCTWRACLECALYECTCRFPVCLCALAWRVRYVYSAGAVCSGEPKVINGGDQEPAALTVAAPGDDEEDESICYDKAKSFFDSISCESIERAKGYVWSVGVRDAIS